MSTIRALQTHCCTLKPCRDVWVVVQCYCGHWTKVITNLFVCYGYYLECIVLRVQCVGVNLNKWVTPGRDIIIQDWTLFSLPKMIDRECRNSSIIKTPCSYPVSIQWQWRTIFWWCWEFQEECLLSYLDNWIQTRDHLKSGRTEWKPGNRSWFSVGVNWPIKSLH